MCRADCLVSAPLESVPGAVLSAARSGVQVLGRAEPPALRDSVLLASLKKHGLAESTLKRVEAACFYRKLQRSR